jgi:hypothetical protein
MIVDQVWYSLLVVGFIVFELLFEQGFVAETLYVPFDFGRLLSGDLDYRSGYD